MIHCAAQRYEGVLSIFIFHCMFKIDINLRDQFGTTALHFATVSMMIENVQAILKFGADPNAQDDEGNSCLHLCIKQMIEIRLSKEDDEANDINEAGFDILKEIAKELLFSGCSRDALNKDKKTARDLFEEKLSLFSDQEIYKIRYILSKPKSCSCLRLTRPIEKVNRNRVT